MPGSASSSDRAQSTAKCYLEGDLQVWRTSNMQNKSPRLMLMMLFRHNLHLEAVKVMNVEAHCDPSMHTYILRFETIYTSVQ